MVVRYQNIQSHADPIDTLTQSTQMFGSVSVNSEDLTDKFLNLYWSNSSLQDGVKKTCKNIIEQICLKLKKDFPLSTLNNMTSNLPMKFSNQDGESVFSALRHKEEMYLQSTIRLESLTMAAYNKTYDWLVEQECVNLKFNKFSKKK